MGFTIPPIYINSWLMTLYYPQILIRIVGIDTPFLMTLCYPPTDLYLFMQSSAFSGLLDCTGGISADSKQRPAERTGSTAQLSG